ADFETLALGCDTHPKIGAGVVLDPDHLIVDAANETRITRARRHPFAVGAEADEDVDIRRRETEVVLELVLLSAREREKAGFPRRRFVDFAGRRAAGVAFGRVSFVAGVASGAAARQQLSDR